MKKQIKTLTGIFFMFLFSLMVLGTGCEKDDPVNNSNCDCGKVVDWDSDLNGYYVKVKNYCSGNYKWFSVSYSDWLFSDYGDECCANSGNSWKVTPTGDPIEKKSTGKYQKEKEKTE